MFELPTEHCFDYVHENISFYFLYEWFILAFLLKTKQDRKQIIKELKEISDKNG